MSTSSSVVQLGAVSSMSGPHSILEVGENNEYKHITKENDTSKSTQQEDTSPNNHLQESDSPSTLPNQPQSAQSNDCVPEDEENTPGADLTSVNKRPPPLEMAQDPTLAAGDGPKTPLSPRTRSGTLKTDREKKIGHRRVGEGGEVTYKKIHTSQIMGSIQLGISHAVGGLASKPERDLLVQDFMTIETTNFYSQGSQLTPAHHYSDFRFKSFAPIAFRYFRDLFGIQPDDFLLSLCNEPLRELTNPGASGSIFYLSADDEFIIKTVQHKEGEFLMKLLLGYYMNLNQNPRTLLPKFFGLYCYICNSKNVRMVVMNNLLPSSIKLHEKYDLKGSTYKRKASKSERSKSVPTFKDLDFLELHPDGIMLEADTYAALIKTIQRDCRVLESFKIMDYSLLVAIHNLDLAAKEEAERRRNNSVGDEESGEENGAVAGTSSGAAAGGSSQPPLVRSRSINRQKLVAHSTALESIQAESEPIDEEDDVPPGGIPARNAKGERLLVFLGIIDILQSYRLKKKLEHTLKAMIHDGDTVSVHRPGFYSQRFQNFMAKQVFRKVPSLSFRPRASNEDGESRSLPSSSSSSSTPPPAFEDILRSAPERSRDQSAAHPNMARHANAALAPRREKQNEGSKMWSSSHSEAIRNPRSQQFQVPAETSELMISRTHRSVYLTSHQVFSMSEVQLEVRSNSKASSLGSGEIVRMTSGALSSGHTPTPTWTEGTPSFTESSSSGELGFSGSPKTNQASGSSVRVRTRAIHKEVVSSSPDHHQDSEMTHL